MLTEGNPEIRTLRYSNPKRQTDGRKGVVTAIKEGAKGKENQGACVLTGAKERSACEGGTHEDGMLQKGHLR